MAFAVAAAATIGCSGDGYQSAEVAGTVTHQGKPAKNLLVQFSHVEPPTSGPARLPPALGITDSEGRYRLMRPGSKKGAAVSRYRVRFSVAEGEGGPVTNVPAEAVQGGSFDVEVKPGTNVLDFAL